LLRLTVSGLTWTTSWLWFRSHIASGMATTPCTAGWRNTSEILKKAMHCFAKDRR
jgi:hypothetical protein